MIMLVSRILDSIAKGISLFPRFFAWCIPTSIFRMIFALVPHIFHGSRINAATRTCVAHAAPLSRSKMASM